MVAHFLHTEGVTGSNPVSPMWQNTSARKYFVSFFAVENRQPNSLIRTGDIPALTSIQIRLQLSPHPQHQFHHGSIVGTQWRRRFLRCSQLIRVRDIQVLMFKQQDRLRYWLIEVRRTCLGARNKSPPITNGLPVSNPTLIKEQNEMIKSASISRNCARSRIMEILKGIYCCF